MKLKGTKMTILLVGVLVVVVVGGLVGFGFFIEVKKEDLKKREVDVARMYAHRQELASLVRLVNESEEERASLYSYILREDQVIDFLALIEGIGREQGVEILTTGLSESTLDDTFEELVVGVTVNGSYRSMLHVLQTFETLPYQVLITNPTFTKQSSKDDVDQWAAQFSIRVTKFAES